MTLSQYIDKIHNRFKSGITTEHSFRGDLQTYLEHLLPGIMVTNEPTRISCGAPDYILTAKEIPVGYIEAKDMGADLYSKSYDEQFKRYRNSLENLIITNYIDFHFFRNGEPSFQISIAKIEKGKVIGIQEQFEEFENRIKDFSTISGQTIKSAEKLSKMMATKARLLALVIEKALTLDEQSTENMVNEGANNSLREQLAGFKQVLIHDIEPKEFADIYAQTIAYGMFAARLHDPSLQTFTRKEAADLIPKSNPFLRKLFQYIAGYDLDPRITWIVDGLADIFRATDVNALLKNFGKSTQQHDPIIHFYETFLSEYDPKLRKARGVWYTPEPVVKFIVRAVDAILKTEFNLPDGLADTSKTKIKVKVPTHDKRYTSGQRDYEQEVHKVQILDPATGTGTFLAEVIKHIYKEKFEGQQGIWSNYVENQLIPRLNGFELLMASYAMAHLKLDMLLTETGYKATKEQRLRVYLTNSLEEYHPETGTLFASWLSSEANEANQIKRDVPVMVVMGNPPYSGESANKGEWIMKLMEDYKKEPGGKEKLKEKNPKWINDDYVKFIRFGQNFIEKNGSGILAFINPHGYLDNPTYRGMRWNLLKAFDKIYTIDLHGNSKKNETSPDGRPDFNVFDIMQGVSINIFVKTGLKNNGELSKVYHHDLFGKREYKYDFLSSTSLNQVAFNEISLVSPYYFFVNKSINAKSEYNSWISLSELFNLCLLGPNSHRDSFAIAFEKNIAQSRINDMLQLDVDSLREKYKLQDNRDWKLEFARKKVNKNTQPVRCLYRPFDQRYMLYGNYAFDYHRPELNDNFLQPNFGIIFTRQTKEEFGLFITNIPLGQHKIATPYDGSYCSPLYLYPQKSGQQSIDPISQRKPNLKIEIVNLIAKNLDLVFNNEKGNSKNTFTPIDIFDYIYAILHSPEYRSRFQALLKIEFPRIPYPKNRRIFLELVKLGNELRTVQLLENPTVNNFITQYPISGSNGVDKIQYDSKKVWINETQYFSSVPEIAWNFYIGGYQPAQKWLKDRKGRILNFEDIQHYQKIIVALTETDRIMKEIDKIDFL